MTSRKAVPRVPDAVQLSIFSNRFMGVAEQMGRTLQRTSVSTNIKERLDFSCALFDPSGGLVANAPHVPVHLGAMSSTVRWQIEHWCGSQGNDAFDRTHKEGLREGDVLVTNHPRAGGSHLPDITVVTPVFRDGVVVFFVASRGHHADVGVSTPGSMPPFSRSIEDEGVAIKAFKLVRAGVYDEKGAIALFEHSRAPADNLSDLNAQRCDRRAPRCSTSHRTSTGWRRRRICVRRRTLSRCAGHAQMNARGSGGNRARSVGRERTESERANRRANSRPPRGGSHG